MPQAVDTVSTTIEQLTERVRDLEGRVAALEAQRKKSGSMQNESVATLPPIQRPSPPATWHGFPPAETPAGAIAIIGKAVLAIAGAYLLRAIAESGAIPKLPVLILAIAYAGAWMAWAVKIYPLNRVASATYAITSALILSPLLWESTVRFHAISPSFTAVVLVAFAVMTFELTLRDELQLIPWIGSTATVVTALALIVATHELVPLTIALLAIALATEIAVCLGRYLTMRAIPAIAADLAILLIIDLMTSDRLPFDYELLSSGMITALCLALLAIYGGSIGVRCFALRHQVTFFEIGQAVLVFMLAAFGVLRTSHGKAPILGLLFLMLSVLCYWGMLSRFAGQALTRTRLVCGMWAAVLFLSASLLLFSTGFAALSLCIVAIAAQTAHVRVGKLSLGVQATFYLLGATAISSVPAYIENALAGSIPAAPDWNVWIVAIAAAICYPIGARVAEDRPRRLLLILPAVLVGFTAAALAIAAFVFLASGRFLVDAPRLSVIRTVVNCTLALVLVFLGSRWKHPELRWVAYATVAFGTLKLLFEDLRFGNAASLVFSLLFYGMVLILLPRLTRREQATLD